MVQPWAMPAGNRRATTPLSTPGSSNADQQAPIAEAVAEPVGPSTDPCSFDFDAQGVFDRIGRIAATAFDVPMAYVSLFDAERQWIQTSDGTQMDGVPIEETLCFHTLRHGDVLVVEDTTLDPAFASNRFVMETPFVRFYAGAPLLMGSDAPMGTLCVVDYSPRKVSDAQRNVLRDLASLTMHQVALQRAALMDGLTGSWNRRMLDKVISAEIRRSERNERKFSIAMIDLDHFKRLNDAFGHATGDDVLIDFARLVRANLRPEDWLFRMGGEEFAALIVDSSCAKAEGLIEQIRSDLAAHGMKVGGRSVTFSCGITDHRPRSRGGSEDDTLATMLVRADEALYQAKANGRNRTVCFDR